MPRRRGVGQLQGVSKCWCRFHTTIEAFFTVNKNVKGSATMRSEADGTEVHLNCAEVSLWAKEGCIAGCGGVLRNVLRPDEGGEVCEVGNGEQGELNGNEGVDKEGVVVAECEGVVKVLWGFKVPLVSAGFGGGDERCSLSGKGDSVKDSMCTI